jgi:hypothetical protein
MLNKQRETNEANKDEYKKIINLYMNQRWLVNKKDALNDLFALGDDTTSKI